MTLDNHMKSYLTEEQMFPMSVCGWWKFYILAKVGRVDHFIWIICLLL